MKNMMLKSMIMIASMPPMTKNPMSTGSILLMQTILMSIMISKIMKSSWFAMITFLMMIGGLMILFTYMSTVAANEKFKMNMKLSMMTMIFIIITDEMMIDYQINENQEFFDKKNEELSMMKIYNKSMLTTTMMIMYLILTMLSINKIIMFNKGPLRSKN